MSEQRNGARALEAQGGRRARVSPPHQLRAVDRVQNLHASELLLLRLLAVLRLRDCRERRRLLLRPLLLLLRLRRRLLEGGGLADGNALADLLFAAGFLRAAGDGAPVASCQRRLTPVRKDAWWWREERTLWEAQEQGAQSRCRSPW